MALNAYPLHAAESERNNKKAIVISKYVIGLSSNVCGIVWWRQYHAKLLDIKIIKSIKLNVKLN